MTFYMLTKGYTVPGNQGTNDKLNQILCQQKITWSHFRTLLLELAVAVRILMILSDVSRVKSLLQNLSRLTKLTM